MNRNSFKTGPVLDFEQDKVDNRQTFQQSLEQKEQEQRLKRTLYGVLDPNHMDVRLPNVPDESGVSFDPDDMTFNI